MNTAYRLIWDDLRNMLVIVDENSRARGKKAGKGGRRVALPAVLFSAALAGALVAPWGGEAWAAICTMQANTYTTNANDFGQTTALACGNNAQAGFNEDQAKQGAYYYMQWHIKTDSTFSTSPLYQDLRDASNYADLLAELQKIASKGTTTTAKNKAANYIQNLEDRLKVGSVAVGNNAKAGLSSLDEAASKDQVYKGLESTIKNDSNFTADQKTQLQGASNYDQLFNALRGIDNPTSRSYQQQLSRNVGLLMAPLSAVAVGDNAEAAAEGAIAVGRGEDIIRSSIKRPGKDQTTSDIAKSYRTYPTGAYGYYDIAVGKAAAHGERMSAATGGDSNTDIGGYFTATGGEGKAIAVGYDALAVRQNTIAVGTQALAAGADAIAVGRNARALTPNSVVIGGGDGGSVGIQGRGAINTPLDLPANGGNSIAIGLANNFTQGYDTNDDYYANTKNSIAIGYRAHTHAANAFAIGVSTDATAERSFAIGTSSTSYKNTASHQGTRAGGQGSLAFGDTAIVKGQGLPTAGTKDEERATYTSVNDAIAVGTNTLAQARNAVVLGGGMSYTYHSGTGNSMTNETVYYKEGVGWDDQRAEGTGANVEPGADGAVAIGGASATVTMKTTGEGANVTSVDNIYFPTKDPNDSLTVTNYTAAAKATLPKSVALGTGSVANRAAGKNASDEIKSGWNVATGAAYASGDGTWLHDGEVWRSTLAAVSVGGGTINGNTATRQITNVAAGYEDTDAVNVAQLKTAGFKVNANQSSATNNAALTHTLGKTLSVKGGMGSDTALTTANAKITGYSGKNVAAKVVQDATTKDNTVYVQISENPEFKSVNYTNNNKTVNITTNTSGALQVGDGTTDNNPVQIVNVKSGLGEVYDTTQSGQENYNNAANIGDVKSLATEVTVNEGTVAPAGGTYSTTGNLRLKSTTGAKGQTIYDVKLADTVTLGSDAAKKVTIDGTAGMIAAGDKVNINGNTGIANIGGVTITGTSGSTSVSGLSNTTWNPNTTYTGGYAATQEQLQAAAQSLRIATDNRNVGLITNAAGHQEITSPYIEVWGVESATKNYNAALNNYLISTEYTSLDDADKPAKLAAEIARLRGIYGFASAAGNYAIAAGFKANAEGSHSIAAGHSAHAEGSHSIAVGRNAHAKETHAIAFGTRSLAQNQGAIAIGWDTNARGNGSVAIGTGSTTDDGRPHYDPNDPNSDPDDEKRPYSAVAIGNNAQATKNYTIALGREAKATKSRSIAIGLEAETTMEDALALGSNSKGDRAAGSVGYDVTTGAAYAGADKNTATWTSTRGAVSVGGGTLNNGKTATRQITNVAAGSDDTDAVNVAQLKLSSTSLTDKGLVFGANASGDANTAVTRTNKLGSTVNVVGEGAKTGANDYSGQNVKTFITQDASGASTITVKIDENPSFTSVTTGPDASGNKTVMNATGVHITKGGKTVNLTNNSGNLDVGDVKIVNVANGTIDSDAVNLGQLKAAKTEVTGSGLANVTYTTGANGQTIYNVDVTANGVVASGDSGIVTGDTIYNETRVTGDSYYVINKGNTAAENLEALDTAIQNATTVAGKHTKVTVEGGTAAATGPNNYSGKNLLLNATDNSGQTTYDLKLNNNLDLGSTGSVKMGDTTINNDGMKITGGPQITKNYVSMGGNKIHNVAPGTDPTDAVNVSQLGGYTKNVTINGKNRTVLVYKDSEGNEKEFHNYNVRDRTEYVPQSVLEAVALINEQGPKFFHTNDGQRTEVRDRNTVDASAEGRFSTAVGYMSTATKDYGLSVGPQNTADGEYSTVVGSKNTVVGSKSTVVGTGHQVYGSGAGAYGDPSYIGTKSVPADGSYAFGNNNRIYASNAFALGNRTRVTADGGVALGDRSVATRGAEPAIGGYDVITRKASADTSPTWRPTAGAVSVGDPGNSQGLGVITRRITGVAAGSEATDAVNVAQLKRVEEYAGQGFTVSAGGNASQVSPGDTIHFAGDGNIHVNLNGQTVRIALDPNLRVQSITLGGRTRVDANGLVINGGPSVTVNGIDAAGRPITNVADGINPYDAVNRGQMDALDQRLSNRIGKVEDKAYAGIASAVAHANIPQVLTPGKGMLGAGLGYYNDNAALGVGYSMRSDNGRWVLRSSLGVNAEEVTVGGGIGYEF